MTVKHDLMVKATAAKRMATMFRNASVTIPVEVNNRMVEVPSADIAASCEKCHRELIEDFVSGLTTEEVISQAYRIANAQRRRLTKADIQRRNEDT